LKEVIGSVLFYLRIKIRHHFEILGEFLQVGLDGGQADTRTSCHQLHLQRISNEKEVGQRNGKMKGWEQGEERRERGRKEELGRMRKKEEEGGRRRKKEGGRTWSLG
jgi:hypothetical protein